MNIYKYKLLKLKCTGCGACEALCHKNAIILKRDKEGFYYPYLNSDVCVNCGICYKKCPIGDNRDITKPLHTYTGYAISDVSRNMGSSGGIIPELAREITRNNGIVFGVAFDNDKKSAIYCDSINYPKETLFRSKYVEASDAGTFLEVKRILSSGTVVLYCGTPCKIDGLLKYLGKNYSNLYTVDFMCHGKPSANLLEDVIRDEETIAGDQCVNVTFREKINGWRKQTIVFYFTGKDPSAYVSSGYYYYNYFLKNYSIRKSCVSCKYYKRHKSDITLSDYWNIDEKTDDDKGSSIIQVNTSKGLNLLTDIGRSIYIKANDSAIKNIEVYSHTLRKGYSYFKRDYFYKMYKKGGLQYIKGKGYKKVCRFEMTKGKILALLIKCKNVISKQRAFF